MAIVSRIVLEQHAFRIVLVMTAGTGRAGSPRAALASVQIAGAFSAAATFFVDEVGILQDEGSSGKKMGYDRRNDCYCL